MLALANAELATLRGMVAASTDACWCMEFGQPVDLTAPDREVVRQVFENDPQWRYCNEAMAKLYRLPAGLDVNERPVSEIFARNEQNAAFVEHLLRNGFEVNAAPALDKRYDGSEIHVENDVRAYIENGKLIRMFGIVRDVSKQRRREYDLQDQLDQAHTILSALPDALIAVDQQLLIVAANPAAGEFLSVDTQSLPGTHLQALLAAKDASGRQPLLALQQAIESIATAKDSTQLQLPLANGLMTHWRIGMERHSNSSVHFVAIVRPAELGAGLSLQQGGAV